VPGFGMPANECCIRGVFDVARIEEDCGPKGGGQTTDSGTANGKIVTTEPDGIDTARVFSGGRYVV